MTKSTVQKIAGFILVGLGMASACFAVAVPEIDASSGANALALLGGAILIIRSRKRS